MFDCSLFTVKRLLFIGCCKQGDVVKGKKIIKNQFFFVEPENAFYSKTSNAFKQILERIII